MKENKKKCEKNRRKNKNYWKNKEEKKFRSWN